MSDALRQKQDEARIACAVQQLGEHFDAVLILASRHEPAIEDGTVCLHDGCGDVNAQFGLARNYVVYAEEHVRIKARRDAIEDRK